MRFAALKIHLFKTVAPMMMDEQEIKNLHKIYPVLSKVDPTLLTQALSDARMVAFKADTLIFEELQPCNAFPFVLSGHIRVFKQSVMGRELSLYNVTPGDACVVTAGCLLGDEPYNARGMAKSDSRLVMMTSDAFENLLGSRVFREFIFETTTAAERCTRNRRLS